MTVGPVPAGAYRYTFNVDGVADDRSAQPVDQRVEQQRLEPGRTCPARTSFDTRNVPHGAVAEVHYHSTALKAFRRMHVYTPPGYETSTDKYPVFYLLHGAGDSDDSWTHGRPRRLHPRQPDRREEGEADDRRHAGRPHAPRAGAAPAIAPATPTRRVRQRLRQRRRCPTSRRTTACSTDRANTRDRRPLDGRQPDAEHRVPHLDQFAYVGVFSSGLLGVVRRLGGPRRRRRAPRRPTGDRRGLGEAQRRGARRRER